MRMPNIVSLLFSGGVFLATFATLCATEFHVTPTGSSQGTGTLTEPWDLATALLETRKVQPGDTLWLHAGVYRGGFESRLSGRPGLPIVVRGARGERVTFDLTPRDPQDNALLLLRGADTVYRDFEVTCNHPQRETKIAGPWPTDIRRGSVDIRGDRISAINLIVHDCAGGFGFWGEGEAGEIAGCLIYNHGWRGPDRGHGHGIYAQNARGTKRIVDNVIFHQFGYGIHVYGSDKASLQGFEIAGNIAFENGCLTHIGHATPGIMLGGGTAVDRAMIRDNTVVGGGIRLGYPWGTTNNNVICTDNYTEGLVLRDFRQATIQRNTIVASSVVVSLEGAEQLLLNGLNWNENDYYVTDGRWGECAVIERAKSRGLSFAEWRNTTGLDAQSTFTKGPPTKQRVIVRPNPYEAGRAHIAVLNPAKLPEIEVDLSSVLKLGQKFRVVSAKDFYGPTILSGRYDGRLVSFPLQPIMPPSPVGMPNATLPVTEPAFAAFVVLSDE